MNIVDHNLVTPSGLVIALPRLVTDATVYVWNVTTDYRENGLFISVQGVGEPQEVPACNHVEPVFTGKLPAHAATAKQAILAALRDTIVTATMLHLDNFAATRNYGSILSAATYATSTVAKFATEGKYAVGARDATWTKLYEMLAEMEAGTLAIPSGFSDILPSLPALAWPA